MAEIDEKIVAGLADVKAGRLYDADEVFDRLKAKYDAMDSERRAG